MPTDQVFSYTEDLDLIQSQYQVLATDPGKSGAVCLLGRGKFEIRRDFKTLPAIARGIRDLALPTVTHAVMELVHAMPGNGVCSMFAFGRAAGVADGAYELTLPGLELEYVTPQCWQGFFRREFSIDKKIEFDSRSLAVSIIPEAAQYTKRVLDHNTGDSILMAVWKLLSLAR